MHFRNVFHQHAARLEVLKDLAGAVTFTLARSPDGTVWETTPRWTWAVTLNGTTEVVAVTNIAGSIIGATHSLKVISVANADDTIVTNAYLKVVKKQVQ